MIYLTSALLDEPSLELQVICTVMVNPVKTGNWKRLRPSGVMPKCSLEIILYGPSDLSDALCTFIDKYNKYLQDDQKLYLQDPIGCDRNVPYCNPHRLPALDPTNVVLTFDLANRRRNPVELEDLKPRPDLLGLLDSQEDLPEAAQPPAITTSLAR